MGDSTRFPTAAAIKRAEQLTRERFVFDGETIEEALAPGSVRRRALDAALAEVDAKLKVPSLGWRREFSLLLGLERVLSEEEPKLEDGTTLNAHQVDALSGTLTALLASAATATTPVVEEHIVADDPASAPVVEPAELDLADVVSGPAVDDEDEDEESDELDAELELDTDADDEDEDDEDDEIDVDVDVELDEAFDSEPESEEEPVADEGVSADEEPQDWVEDAELDEDIAPEGAEDDPGADRRFWFEHATGAGKTVAAMGFVEASRTGGVLILTHRRNLVDQFIGEIKTRGYRDRLCQPLLIGEDAANGPVTVETYQWFVRNAGKISDAYTVVICDEAHTALGEKTSAQIRSWQEPIWIGMTATGALIARHVTDLFPTQTSRFDLAQAARRGVIAPLRDIRIPPGPGVRTIAKVPLRRGEVDTEFDQEMLAQLLDQTPFNLAIADLYKTRFNGVPGVVYAAGVQHAYNVAESFRAVGIKAMGVSGETPKRELASILADYETGKIDVLVNAQLLAEGWNSPRATVCMHLAPTASKRIYQQRVGRVTRRHPGKEAGIVVDFVHPATKHDDPVVTLHSLLDRDVYRGGAIVVGPVRRGRGRRVRVERRVLPVTPDPTRRAMVFERELWRIAVENLDYGEQKVWAQLAGARVAPNGWRRAKAMLHFDRQGELKRLFLLTTLQRNKSQQLRLRALQEIAASKDAEAFTTGVEMIGTFNSRDERREGVKVMLQALAERRIGRRDQANNWIWQMAEYTREVHEEYAVQRWPETKRLLGLLVNSSGAAHARNARRLVHATRKEDRRLSAALLAAALAHTPEAADAINSARARMARKPAALARELLRNFPKGKRSKNRRRKGKNGEQTAAERALKAATAAKAKEAAATAEATAAEDAVEAKAIEAAEPKVAAAQTAESPDQTTAEEKPKPRRRARTRSQAGSETVTKVEPEANTADTAAEATADAKVEGDAEAQAPAPAPRRRTRAKASAADDVAAAAEAVRAAMSEEEDEPAQKPAPRRRTRKPAAAKATETAESSEAVEADTEPAEPKPAAKPRARRTTAAAKPAAKPATTRKSTTTAKSTTPRKSRAASKPADNGNSNGKVTAGEAEEVAQLDLDLDLDAA
jgi:ribonuclease E